MDKDDRNAILWLEEECNFDPAIKNAWAVLKKYYETCRNELLNLKTNNSPFFSNGSENRAEMNDLFKNAKQYINNKDNKPFIEEASQFFGIDDLSERIKQITEEENPSNESKWLVTKFVRLYNMRLKLGHSARIKYIAQRGLDHIPEGKNADVLRRTVFLSALLHDVGRFYQAIHYNNFFDSTMKENEHSIGSVEVDHAVAGYYYSLGTSLELHKISKESDEEAVLKYISEAIASCVVRYHQMPNDAIPHFDFDGNPSLLNDDNFVDIIRGFIDKSYEDAKLMGWVLPGSQSKHIEFIKKFLSTINENFLDRSEINPSNISRMAAEFYSYDNVKKDLLDDLASEIIHILNKSRGLSAEVVAKQIIECESNVLKSNLYKDLIKLEISEEEKTKLCKQVEENIKGMLNFDISVSVNQKFKEEQDLTDISRYLITTALSLTMDADKIDILNQRALGIFDSSYDIETLSIFPPDNMSLREILNNYFHFNISDGSFVIDDNILQVMDETLKSSVVFNAVKEYLGEFNIFDKNSFPRGNQIIVSKDKVTINGKEYQTEKLFNLFNGEWNGFLREYAIIPIVESDPILKNKKITKMIPLSERKYTSFVQFKTENHGNIQIKVPSKVLDANLDGCNEEEVFEAYKRLLVTDGLKERFLLEGDNKIPKWVALAKDSDHIIHSNIAGAIWCLNQFIMVNMRNKSSLEFILEKNENGRDILEELCYIYNKTNPILGRIIKEYVGYTKEFIKTALEEVQGDKLTPTKLSELRKENYAKFTGGAPAQTKNI